MKYNFIASSVRADRRNDEAHVNFMNSSKPVNIGDLIEIDGLLWTVEEVKKVWSEDEIKNLVQTNDKVLYGALKNLYNCQTADEQSSAETTHVNGAGFNAVDAKFLTSVSQFLINIGFLTDKQKVIVRKKLVKYNKQLTALANA